MIVVAACWILFQNSRDNSFDYQYNRAIECAADNHYDEAISYLEKQLHWIQMQQAQDSFWLNITIKMVSSKSAILVLQELIGLNVDNVEEIYDYLLSIYQNRQDYAKMGELLKECDSDTILAKYNEYAALPPEFNKRGWSL